MADRKWLLSINGMQLHSESQISKWVKTHVRTLAVWYRVPLGIGHNPSAALAHQIHLPLLVGEFVIFKARDSATAWITKVLSEYLFMYWLMGSDNWIVPVLRAFHQCIGRDGRFIFAACNHENANSRTVRRRSIDNRFSFPENEMSADQYFIQRK
jgi:hypothetical protein